MSLANKIVAVIVTYHPVSDDLVRLVASLQEQVDIIVVVDNGSASFDCNIDVELIKLESNMGIAFAQNMGIKWAIDHYAQFVVLFDQDSDPSVDMIARLLDAHSLMIKLGHRVAAVGPSYFDDRQKNPPPFIRVEGCRLVRVAKDVNDIVSVDYLISSGSLISVDTLSVVGLMNDRLFIDYVDIEWGLRASRFGYQSFGVFSARMKHSIGSAPIRFLNKNYPNHSPLRHYYHFRNAVWLYKQSWLPFNWKIVDASRLFLKYIFYSLFSRPRFLQIAMMTMGVWHGIIGRMGKYGLD